MLHSRALAIRLGAALILSIGSAVPALAAELVLSPSSEWRFEKLDDRCKASRQFGEEDERTTLWIEQGGAEPNYNLTLIGEPLRNPYGPAVRIRFGEEDETIRSYIAVESSSGRPVLAMFGVGIVQPVIERDSVEAAPVVELTEERAEAISSLRLRNAIADPLHLDIGSFAGPYAFLDQCGEELSVLLSEAGRPLTAKARPPEPIDQDSWLSTGDWPHYLQRAEMGGSLTVRLTVNATGKPSSCFVIKSNKPQLFDDAVCLGLLKRAKFDPARTAKGEPVASYFQFAVTFRME